MKKILRKMLAATAVMSMLMAAGCAKKEEEQAGGEICGRMAILAEGDAIGREDIRFLEPLPLFRPDGTPLD